MCATQYEFIVVVHCVLFQVVTNLSHSADVVRRVGGLGPTALKKSFNQAFGKLSDHVMVVPRPRSNLAGTTQWGFLRDFLDPTADLDSASLQGLSDDEDETASLLLRVSKHHHF